MKPAHAHRTRPPAARRFKIDIAVRAAAIAAIILLVCPATNRAAEHLMVVQEVFAGTPAAPGAQYVMLRMTFQNQTQLNTHYISIEDTNGVMLGRFGTFDHNMGTGGAACSWPNCPAIVMGTAAAQSLFGFSFDQIVDAQAGRIALPMAGGRVCFRRSDNSAMDCVAYGNYVAANTIPTPTNNGCDANFGSTAAALSLGFALTRTVFNCAAKENSTDFTNRFPHPVANNGANANVDADADQLINVLDACDADNQAWYPPIETLGLSVGPGVPTSVTWTSQNATTGASTRYDVVSGDLGDVRQFRDFTLGDCMSRDVNGTSTTDPDPDPLPGHARYYLVRARHCLAGTYGDSSLNPDPRDLLDDRVMGPCL